MPTDAERACFEAGIKFGSLYHQFAGTPVSPDSAESLGRAMEAAIENQPHCVDVDVAVRTDRIAAELDAQSADYTELTGRFMDVGMRIERAGVTVRTRMEMDGDYPTMQLVDVEPDGSNG
ncbi:hypothetical protein GCM10008995_08200 [Halobellus salinus]|uniref:Dihydroneopterin aldolase n=1 Tax=Halobellus salinus TaxID=931585 RepID=A0A830E8T5_9EURY|nr:dihydroneopterin aldolase family protein [Halobellus salinus]GGJ00741.1 hypothetical protein GCM10008995_08200 [Halobellus salinus]SMP01252.1 hypothetical protein SAMN06265347_10187 [Halobellus salinus]